MEGRLSPWVGGVAKELEDTAVGDSNKIRYIARNLRDDIVDISNGNSHFRKFKNDLADVVKIRIPMAPGIQN